MREVLDMPKGLTGVYITKTEPLFDASRWVRWDCDAGRTCAVLAWGQPAAACSAVTKFADTFTACPLPRRQLMAGDVLTHFNGVEIADDGTFLFREAVRINFGHLVSQAFNGEVAMVSCRAEFGWVCRQ
eukprot:GHRQ01017423.1.p6 GENE.GHRQ01017423.1~~GHRQ01017423.1.p6  ORF type:complete len:129 (-),score=46.53 GHRQ01017423.1:1719-2105(-)